MAEVVAHAAQERPAIAVTNNHEPRRIWILHRADGVRGYLLILPRPRLPSTRSPACILSTAWQMASLASPSTMAAVASTCSSLHMSRARARICRVFSSCVFRMDSTAKGGAYAMPWDQQHTGYSKASASSVAGR